MGLFLDHNGRLRGLRLACLLLTLLLALRRGPRGGAEHEKAEPTGAGATEMRVGGGPRGRIKGPRPLPRCQPWPSQMVSMETGR